MVTTKQHDTFAKSHMANIIQRKPTSSILVNNNGWGNMDTVSANV